MPTKVAKEFADSDKPGKLPARVKDGKPQKKPTTPRTRPVQAGRPGRGGGY